jgi:hypothetical protein
MNFWLFLAFFGFRHPQNQLHNLLIQKMNSNKNWYKWPLNVSNKLTDSLEEFLKSLGGTFFRRIDNTKKISFQMILKVAWIPWFFSSFSS